MIDQEFKELVRDMRQAQKNYFTASRIKDPIAKKRYLKQSMALEQRVDSILAGGEQGNLGF